MTQSDGIYPGLTVGENARFFAAVYGVREREQGAAHWGGGERWHTSPRDSVVVSYRFQHFSNGNQLSTNPGVNSHVLLAGWSHRSQR